MNNSAKFFLKPKNRIKLLYLAGFLLLLVVASTSILAGSTHLTFNEIKQAFTEGFSASAGSRIFGYVRLPRTVASLLCGAALAVSGVVIQNVLSNPLASPSIIGVNSGAGLAITLCTALGIYDSIHLSFFSFAGAFLSVMIVNLGAKRWGVSRSTIILMGVAMNSLLGAASDAIISFSPEVGVMSNGFKVGEFSAVTFQQLLPSIIIVSITFVILMTLGNQLDILTFGDDTARGIGMNTTLLRTIFLMLAALLASCAVSIAGLLSFVGLIVPHIIRRISKEKALHLMGLSAIYGASFVCICDTIARTAFSPYEIPVGIIMAFLGAPFFIFILIKGKGGHANA